MSIPDGTIANLAIAAGASIDATKLVHQYEKHFDQESATTALDESRVIHVVQGATATVIAVKAGSVVANIGDSTVTVDLLKNGTTILSAVITLDSGDAAYDLVAAAINTAALVVDDVLEIVVNATVGTGTLAKGVFANVIIREDAA